MSEGEDGSRPARPGTAADLSWRMDRLEQNHDHLAKEVGLLTGTVARVELNQQHAEELNKLRFGSLDTSVGQIGTDLKNFMGRIEGILTGDVETIQTRQGQAIVEDFTRWRKAVDADLEDIKDARLAQNAVNSNNRQLRQGAWIVIATVLSLASGVVGALLAHH